MIKDYKLQTKETVKAFKFTYALQDKTYTFLIHTDIKTSQACVSEFSTGTIIIVSTGTWLKFKVDIYREEYLNLLGIRSISMAIFKIGIENFIKDIEKRIENYPTINKD